MDTTLTSLSGLPSLSKSVGGKTDKILSLDIDQILNPSTTGVLAKTEDDLDMLDYTGSAALKREGGRKSDEIHTLLTLTATTNSEHPQPSSATPTSTVSTAVPNPEHIMPSKESSTKDFDENLGSHDDYDDDFEEISPKKNDSYTLDNENLSGLSEEITSTSSSINLSKEIKENPLLQTSELLKNDNIVTPDDNLSQEEDYNQMTEIDYNKRKAEMEVEFKKKQIKPGDLGFVYDKEVNFDTPKIESGWDDGNSSESEF